MVSAIIKEQSVKDWIFNNLKNMLQIMKDQFSETINYTDIKKIERINQYNSHLKNADSKKGEHKVVDNSNNPIK